MKRHFFKQLFLAVIVLVFWVALLLAMVGGALLSTTWGAKMAVGFLIKKHFPTSQLTYTGFEGSILKGIVIKDITIKDIPQVKSGSITIQEFYLQIPLPQWEEYKYKLLNGRINFVSIDSDPIIVNLAYGKGKIQGDCYTKSVDVREVLNTLGYTELARNVFGILTHVDLDIDGVLLEPHFKGHFMADKFSYKSTVLQDGFGQVDLTVQSLGEKPQLMGQLKMESAAIKTFHLHVDLTASKVYFTGDATNPQLDIHGTTTIEDTVIDMTINGTLQKPELLFNSDPPRSEDQILGMLATGKSWSSFEDQNQGFGLRKKLTDAFNVGMKVEERTYQPGQSQSAGYNRTIDGQFNVTDRFSLNVTKKFYPSDASTQTGGTPNLNNDRNDDETELYLQYKKRF